MIPPLAILPILFIVFGLGELSKVALIVIGTAPFLIRDLAQRVLEIPPELIIKAQTLGASSGVIALRVALPQIMPRLIQAVRLALGPAWLFLIAAEAIAAENGLGYRIFLVRRYLAMDVILTYVIWITFLAFLSDLALRLLARRLYPWAGAAARMSYVSVRNVFVSYGQRPILERVSLDVKEGEFVSIVGASGCGKSTFLRLLLAQETADQGRDPHRRRAARAASRTAPAASCSSNTRCSRT